MKNLIVIIFFISTTICAQLDISLRTNKETYEYGEKIELYCKITNPEDTTFKFLAGSYQSCQAEFSFNNFNSWEYADCLTLSEWLTFKPHSSKIYKWIIDPEQTGLPNKDGLQQIVGYYYFNLTDTIYINAPQILGGKLEVSFLDSVSSEVQKIKDSLNIVVLKSSKVIDRYSETWELVDYRIDSLIMNFNQDSLFTYSEQDIFITYSSITDENPVDYYPLQIGNKWYYSEVGVTYDVEPHPIDMKYKVEITNDSLINNKLYYLIEGTPYDKKYWIRADSSRGIIYRYYDDTKEYIQYNLAATTNDITETYEGNIIQITNRDTLLWNEYRNQMINNFESLFTQQISFVQNIGIVHKYNIFDFGYSRVSLLGCSINGNTYGDTVLTGLNEEKNNLPNKFSLSQNYPNPFNPTTAIKYTIPNVASSFSSSVTLKVYNLLGQEVATLVNRKQNAGSYEVGFDASNLSSGIYYYQLKANDFVQTKKMILVK